MNPIEKFEESEIEIRPGEISLDALSRITNNFFMHFRLDNFPTNATELGIDPDNEYRRLAKKFFWSKPYEEAFPDRKNKEGNSEKFLKQTGAEFYRELDATIVELGIPIKTVWKLVNRFTFKGNTLLKRQKIGEPLLKVTLPIYAAMRKKGYSRFDLRA